MTLLDLEVTHGGLLDAAAAPRGVDLLDLTVDMNELAELAELADASDVEADDRVGSSFARCADGNGTLTHLFFSDDEFDVARAKAICSKCGLAEGCLRDALDRAEPYGVWGGQLLVDGVVVAIKRGRGRPPKHPRVLIVDEVPLPPHLVA